MNVKKIIKQLREKYPGKTIIQNRVNDGEVTEIVCEIEPTADHPEWSDSVVILDRSSKHFHKEITETYKVLQGELQVYIDGKKYILQEGDCVEIPTGKVHYAIGEETWFSCKSEPGWIMEDYRFVSDATISVD